MKLNFEANPYIHQLYLVLQQGFKQVNLNNLLCTAMATQNVLFIVVIHDAWREQYRFQVFGDVLTSVSLRRVLRELMR